MSEFLGTDRYKPLHQLGAGGMGSVYAVQDLRRKRTVALKMLHVRNAASIVRFKREFRAVANLRHPNLVRLYELTTYEDGLCFTMEMVHGTDMMDYLLPEATGSDSTMKLQRQPLRRWSPPSMTGSNSNQIFGANLSGTSDTMPVIGSDQDPDRPPTGEGHNEAVEAFDEFLLSLRMGSDPKFKKRARSMAGVQGRKPLTEKIAWPLCDPSRLRVVFAQILDALEYLHARGIVHRDLKPDNILINGDGQVKLVDFGIAKNLTEIGKLSITGGPMGTPAYIAPESAEGRTVTPAADLYSLGCILFEAITGLRPFEGNPLELLWQHQHADAPKISDFVHGAPPHLEKLCISLMNKEPQRRPDLDRVRDLLQLSPELDAHHVFGTTPEETPRLPQQTEKLSLLLVRMVRASQGRRQLLLLESNPQRGGGNPLSIALGQQAEEQHFQVFRSHCLPSENLPYRAFDPLLDDLALEICKWPDVSLVRMAAALRNCGKIFASFHVIFERRWDIFGPPEDKAWSFQDLTPDQLQEVIESLAMLLREQSLQRPSVIMLHDFHNADQDSIDMLHVLLQHTVSSKIAVACFYHTDKIAQRPGLRHFLQKASTHKEALHLRDY